MVGYDGNTETIHILTLETFLISGDKQNCIADDFFFENPKLKSKLTVDCKQHTEGIIVCVYLGVYKRVYF